VCPTEFILRKAFSDWFLFHYKSLFDDILTEFEIESTYFYLFQDVEVHTEISASNSILTTAFPHFYFHFHFPPSFSIYLSTNVPKSPDISPLSGTTTNRDILDVMAPANIRL
jgi:hypothetical protein